MRFVVLLLIIGGCSKPLAEMSPAQSDTQTTSTFEPTDLTITNGLARFDLHITVSNAGLLSSTRTLNKHFDPNEKLGPEQIEIHHGQLTTEQQKKLNGMFDGFTALSDKPYGSVPDADGIQLRHGNKTVTGGSEMPKQVTAISSYLQQLAETLPIVTR